VAYADLGRTEEAVAALKRALRARPAFADAHYNLGKVQERAGRFADARDSYRRALAIAPEYAAAKHNLARVLRRLGEVAAALALARELHAAQPDDVDRILGLAAALADSGGPQEGAGFLEQCLKRMPAEANLHGERAGMLFAAGEWRAAWREYLWRPGANRSAVPFPEQLPPDLAGKVVALVPDQGLGDMLFFLRFAAAVRARGGRATFQPPPKLAPLLAAHPDLDEAAPDDAFDHAVLLGDLPYVLDAGSVMAPFPLRARADLVRAWREALTALGPPPYVGLTWRAGTDLRTTSSFVDGRPVLFKEIPLDLLAGVAGRIAGTLISVQRLPAPGETERLAGLAGRPVHDLSAANDDLERMLALLAILDEYVGVSNTNMHLCAGVARTARVLVPYPAEFRWAGLGEESPWFPGFGVYRQRADGSWDGALARLSSELEGAS
jgi:Flp pilus assembly protein TadD